MHWHHSYPAVWVSILGVGSDLMDFLKTKPFDELGHLFSRKTRQLHIATWTLWVPINSIGSIA